MRLAGFGEMNPHSTAVYRIRTAFNHPASFQFIQVRSKGGCCTAYRLCEFRSVLPIMLIQGAKNIPFNCCQSFGASILAKQPIYISEGHIEVAPHRTLEP